MKTRILALAVTALTMSASMGAQAVTCANGVYRAGCVGPNGAVVARKVPPPRAVVVTPAPVVVTPAPVVVRPAHGCRWVNGVKVCH